MNYLRACEYHTTVLFREHEPILGQIPRASTHAHIARPELRARTDYPDIIGPTCAICPERSRWAQGRRACPDCPRRLHRMNGLASLS